ncbi:hypothetical protein COW81_00855 [Candidatus Campbellbacteria bacterium CG22_combo_CG10-13_8_21_14_all_36_13]|uniref:PDZ domain-containing protein n=1 Tax=Candidatus Campbellbacteria bacterium CG22_combo_CG10-13_8_21_14_all_36_13 TaxID=1974529 RepID=A0A2H0DYS3_9BACT|nr:MAG: hypothetical protein COW81_00855 [Candidatus Campbellbacteria bacterium CG22_combo_CG10-13_8_21_14_all_36_13]
MTIIIFILVLIILILVHELGHFLFAKMFGIRVDEFGLGFPPRIWGYKPKGSETTYSINAIPFGGFVKIYGEDYDSIEGDPDRNRSFVLQDKWKQTLVLFAGILFNIILAWILISSTLLVGVNYGTSDRYSDRVIDPGVVVANVLSDSPADVGGLMLGDKILFVSSNGVSIQGDEVNPDSITEVIKGSDGSDMDFLVKRGEENVTLKVTPSEEIIPGSFAIGVSMINSGKLKLPPHLAIVEGARITYELTGSIIGGVWGLLKDTFSGNGSMANVVGPVGIAGLVGDASRMGFVALIIFVAMISLHLAVLNLIPFPALDGGRILFVIIEKIKGSPLNPKIVSSINLIGFGLLLLLLLFVTYKDIVRLF